MRTDIPADCEKTQAPPLFPGDRDLRDRIQKERESYKDAIGAGTCSRPYSDSEIVAELFKYHSPTIEQLPRYSAINQAAKNFAEVLLANCPPCADRSAAIRLLRDARMTANAAIALNGLSL
jgi:hypothetical protein